LERLRLADLQRISVVLKDLYELADISAFRQRLLSSVPPLVPTDRVSVVELNPRLRQVSGESAPGGALEGDRLRLTRQYAGQSPMLKGYERGDGSAIKLSDFVTRRQLHQSAYYTEYLRKLDAEHLMAKGLPGRPGWVTFLMLSRSVRDFSERDRLVLNVLRPHLNQAYRNAVAVTASRVQLKQIEEGADTLDRGLVLDMGRRAVEKHLEHIYPKLGVETRTAAAARALALLSSPR
jgi:DNA-binding CsgD family transcriptional regulator